VQTKIIGLKSVFILLVWFSFVFWPISTRGQQRSHLLFFKDNIIHFNPSHAGVNPSKIQIGSRSQWLGIKNAPRVNSLRYISAKKKNVTWGYNMETDRVFIENKNSISADYSYQLKLGDQKTIYLGMRVGIYSYNFDVNELVRVTNEPNEMLEAVRGYVGNIIGVGLFYSDVREKVEHFFSYSIPNTVNLRRFKAENGITTEVTDRVHHYFVGGSSIKMGENNLIPHFLVRQVKHAPVLYSFIIGFDFKKNFEIGFGVTNNDYLSGYFSLKKSAKFNFGIGYEFPSSTKKTALRKGTVEFNLIYKLNSSAAKQMIIETINTRAID
jgi:type IX secretion system PorP/SprF family membrane protein